MCAAIAPHDLRTSAPWAAFFLAIVKSSFNARHRTGLSALSSPTYKTKNPNGSSLICSTTRRRSSVNLNLALMTSERAAVVQNNFNKTVTPFCALAFLWKALGQNQSSKTAGPFRVRLFEFILSFGLVIHAAHAARWHWRSFFLLRNFRDQCFRGEQQAADGRGVLQRAARDFRRIDDTSLHQVGVFTGGYVVTFVAFALDRKSTRLNSSHL